MYNVTHLLLVIGKKRGDETSFHKMQNVTHSLFVIGNDMIRLPFTKCPMSLTSCWSEEKCDETAFHKMCNGTHSLFIIRIHVMRLPFIKCALSLTFCWLYKQIWWDCFSQNVQSHSLPVSNRKTCHKTAFEKMWNITHKLLVIGKALMRLPLQNVQCHSQAVCHRKRCDETAFHRMCNATHSLLIIGEDVMRQPFTKCAISHTSCWS